MSTVEKRVARGYEWLKDNHPDRIAGINLGHLDVQSGDDCPLGQTIGYDATARAHHYNWVVDHGFEAADGDDDDEYEELTDAWVAVLGADR